MSLKLTMILTFLLSSTICWSQKTVVIDAGHGGKSPGAVSGKTYEKSINLDIALLAQKFIKELDGSIKVIQTRTNDVDVSLYKRAELANNNKANLFISIHTNANPSKNANGIETYVMGVDKSGKNLSVAMAENEVITLEDDYQKRYEGYDPNSPESFIIFSLMQYAYLDQSLKFAEVLQGNYKSNTGLVNRGVKQAGFLVLWNTTMPSVLTEVGFLSNENDKRYITSNEGKNAIARSIAKAVVEFLKSSTTIEQSVQVVKPKPLIEMVDDQANNPKDEQKEPPTSVSQGSKGVYYTVQVTTASSKLDINPTNFGRWVSVVKEFYSQKMYKYSIGELFSYKEALTLRTKLKEKYNDCFVVAYNSNQRITIKEAQQILGK